MALTAFKGEPWLRRTFGELLSQSSGAPEVQRPAPADLSTIGYTSGTTGHQKGAMQSHRAVFLNTAAL
jgi:long-chain acyl-CoA synthetase